MIAPPISNEPPVGSGIEVIGIREAFRHK